ncbi:MAG TPA: glycine--tRNA ligase [Methanomassiliicoccales archaeon]|mgnify:FL=1|nr:glycine--tRNA ligase [Methanomassiliicoccales archaeon]
MKEVSSGEMLSLCKRRGFIYPAYEIYGGIAGLYDYGPLGTALKANIADLWRRIYALQEGFVEIDGDNVGPEAIFKASGHVDNFADLSVTCKQCGESYRADHLAKGLHPNPDSLSIEELQKVLRDNNVKCPCGGEFADVEEFNLMFKTKIGPGNGRTGYLRPETAQSIFVNYTNLYRHCREKLPFGCIQVGRGFRNEISPRQGVIRLREFNMMEAELFVDPEDKSWPRYNDVKDKVVKLVPNTDEKEVEMTIGQAVEDGIIGNQTLGYFIWVTYDFLTSAGIDPAKLRFRQHLRTEMAHYAADCWDAETLISFGWTEIVGIADRGCWDLSQHMKFSKADLTAFKRFDEPKDVERDAIKPKFGALGPRFKGAAGDIKKQLEAMDASAVHDGLVTVTVDGQPVDLDSTYYEVVRVKEKVNGVRVIPHVIEPSHGLDRILYSCLEHAYSEKEDGYVTLKLKPAVAPIKVGVFPLMAKDGMEVVAQALDKALREEGVATYYDDSGSIGRRYARMDEAGTPWCVTIDYDTLEKGDVTIRDRDTSEQLRMSADDVVPWIKDQLKRKLSC